MPNQRSMCAITPAIAAFFDDWIQEKNGMILFRSNSGVIVSFLKKISKTVVLVAQIAAMGTAMAKGGQPDVGWTHDPARDGMHDVRNMLPIEGGGTENCAEIDLPRSKQARYFNACYSDGLYFNENVLKRENPGKSCFKFYSQGSGGGQKYYHNNISYHPESCVALRVSIAPPSYGDSGTGNTYSFDFVDGPTDGIRAVLLQQRNEYHGDHVPYRSLGFSRIPGDYADYEKFCHDGFYYSQGMNRNCSGDN